MKAIGYFFGTAWGLEETAVLGHQSALWLDVAWLGPTSRPGHSQEPPPSALSQLCAPLALRWGGGGKRPQISPITEALKIASRPRQGGAGWGSACASPAPHSNVPQSVSHCNSCGRDWTSGLSSAAHSPTPHPHPGWPAEAEGEWREPILSRSLSNLHRVFLCLDAA